MKWLDKIIEEQKCNTDIMDRVCSPYTPSELQEQIECGLGFDKDIGLWNTENI